MFTVIKHDLRGDEIASFLAEHIAHMRAITPLESSHALDLEALRNDDIVFWAVKDDHGKIVGTGALKFLGNNHGEIKSMRTLPSMKRKGLASMILATIIGHAKSVGLERVSLETGSADFFEPARKLYEKFGFIQSPPFADYHEDPNSVFYVLEIKNE